MVKKMLNWNLIFKMYPELRQSLLLSLCMAPQNDHMAAEGSFDPQLHGKTGYQHFVLLLTSWLVLLKNLQFCKNMPKIYPSILQIPDTQSHPCTLAPACWSSSFASPGPPGFSPLLMGSRQSHLYQALTHFIKPHRGLKTLHFTLEKICVLTPHSQF